MAENYACRQTGKKLLTDVNVRPSPNVPQQFQTDFNAM